MKPFLLFAGDAEPQGGWDDLQDSFDTRDAAIRAGVILKFKPKAKAPSKAKKPRRKSTPKPMTWWHVVDVTSWEVVADHIGEE